MAEIGLIAAVVGLLGAGAKLSITLFDFASSLGSAGSELQHVATEITLFCSVAKQLRQTLVVAGAIYSSKAVTNVREILDCCETTFKSIESVVGDLRATKGPEFFPSVDFVNKVKWTFKKPQVQMLRSTLESCKITLHIMLSTMEVARKVSMGKHPDAKSIADDEQDTLITQSLIISQQCVVNELSHFEDEVEKEEDPIVKRLGHHGVNTAGNTGKQTHRVHRLLEGLSIHTTSDEPLPSRHQRNSVWLNKMVDAEEIPAAPHPGMAQRRFSSAGTDGRALQLLKKWTILGKTATVDRMEASTPLQTHTWPAYDVSLPNDNVRGLQRTTTDRVSPTTVDDPAIRGIERIPTDRVSPTSDVPVGRGLSQGPGQGLYSISESAPANGADRKPTPIPMAVEAAISSADNVDLAASTRDIIAICARQYGLTADDKGLSLSIAFGGKVRAFTEIETPLEVFYNFQELGLDPRLFLHKSDLSTQA